jgi:hypothetical protein
MRSLRRQSTTPPRMSCFLWSNGSRAATARPPSALSPRFASAPALAPRVHSTGSPSPRFRPRQPPACDVTPKKTRLTASRYGPSSFLASIPHRPGLPLSTERTARSKPCVATLRSSRRWPGIAGRGASCRTPGTSSPPRRLGVISLCRQAICPPKSSARGLLARLRRGEPQREKRPTARRLPADTCDAFKPNAISRQCARR